MVQWLGFCAFITKGPGSIPGKGQETKIVQPVCYDQKKKKIDCSWGKKFKHIDVHIKK